MGLFTHKEDLKESLKLAFNKIRNDFNVVYKWLNYIRKKEEQLETNQSDLIKYNNENKEKLVGWMTDIVSENNNKNKKLYDWVQYLNKENESLKKDISKLGEYVMDLHKEMKEVFEKIESLENKPVVNNEEELLSGIVIDENLTKSEKELLDLLYLSETPLRYQDIANRLGLNYGTVKNRVYKIKKKGFKIDFDVGFDGEKQLFLDKDEKLRISGR
jgi:DNA-directed RNA polymerase specialized sigma24 family protein